MRSWVAIVVLGLLCGCEEKPVAPPRVQPTYGSGRVIGTVNFAGSPPPQAEIANQPCHSEAGPLKEEVVVVNPNGTLANVFIHLAGDAAPPSDGSQKRPALLDQVNCRYIPHAVAVQVGQSLRIKSSDPTIHNVHYAPQHNQPANFGMTTAGAERSVTFDKQEYISVRCDVHPWMSAWVGVFDNPFFAVTPEGDGGFEIAKVPPGKYNLIAWHERLGRIEQAVEVKENEAVDVTLEYKERSKEP